MSEEEVLAKQPNGVAPVDIFISDEGGSLDAEEFDLPSVEGVQSVEEILREEDSGTFLLSGDELDAALGGTLGGGSSLGDAAAQSGLDVSDLSSLPSLTSASASSLSTSNEWKKPKRATGRSELLRLSKLRGISSQVGSAGQRIGAGTATCLALSQDGDLVAVGTSQGMVMVFELKAQKLRFCLGTGKGGGGWAAGDFGQASALSFSRSSGKLLAGFGKGHVVLLDAASGKVAGKWEAGDIHQEGKGVTQLVFTDANNVAVLVDSGGSVFELRLGGGLAGLGSGVKVRCVFSGAKGEVCAVAPLRVPEKQRATSKHYVEPSLLAMASLTKVMVVNLRAPTAVHLAVSLASRPDLPPLLAWQWLPIQISEDKRIVDPVLAFCRGPLLSFYHLHTADGQTFRHFLLQEVELGFSPITMEWLNSRCLGLVSDRERLELFEAGASAGEEILESRSLGQLSLVYASADYKGLASGGGVSEALAYVAEKCAYQCLRGDGNGRLFVLGTEGVWMLSLRSWLERVESLSDEGDFPGAIQLCLDFHQGTLRLGVGGQGTSGDGRMGGSRQGSQRWRALLVDKLTSLLLAYAEEATTKAAPTSGGIHLLEEHYKACVPVVISTAIKIQAWDLLYGEIWETFGRDPVARTFFLDCLEEYVLDGALEEPPPALVQDYLAYLEGEGMLASVEASVLRLPIHALDIHQVMRMCRAHGLHDCVIHVHNKALLDFVSPLEEMLKELGEGMGQDAELLSDQQVQLGNKTLLYVSSCLTGSAYPVGELAEPRRVAEEVTAVLQRSTAAQAYPNVRLLLRFDTREFLNVLSMAFHSDYFAGARGDREVQRWIDILLEVVLKGESFSTMQLGAFFAFIARLAVGAGGEVRVAKEDFNRLLELVLVDEGLGVASARFEERQTAVLGLLASPLTAPLLQPQLVLQCALKGRFLQVAEFLYRQDRRFPDVLRCYLEDPPRAKDVFRVARGFLAGDDLLKSEKMEVLGQLEKDLEALCDLSVSDTTELLSDVDEAGLGKLVAELEKTKPHLVLQVLNELAEYRSASGQTTLCADDALSHQFCLAFLRLTAGREDMGELERGRSASAFLSAWVLSQSERRREEEEELLRLLRRLQLLQPLLLILEERGELDEARAVVLERLVSAAEPAAGEALVDFGRLSAVVEVGLELAGRCECSRRAVEGGRQAGQEENLWFPVLDQLLSLPASAIADVAELKALLSRVVHSMISYVKPVEVLERLFEHPALRKGTWGEWSDLVQAILSSYDYEARLLESSLGAVQRDSAQLFGRSVEVLARAARPSVQGQCPVCQTALGPSQTATALPCGHVCHTACLASAELAAAGVEDGSVWLCVLCQPDARPKAVAALRASHRHKAEEEDKPAVGQRRRRSTLRSSAAPSLLQQLGKGLRGPGSLGADEDGGSIFNSRHFALQLLPPPMPTPSGLDASNPFH